VVGDQADAFEAAEELRYHLADDPPGGADDPRTLDLGYPRSWRTLDNCSRPARRPDRALPRRDHDFFAFLLFLTGPYFLRAARSQAWRFLPFGFFLHAFSATLSFCARVKGFALGQPVTVTFVL
jgi:hypothetical protein